MSGWEMVRLGDVCTPEKVRHAGELMPYIGMEHMESGTGRLVTEPEPMLVKSATFRFSRNHVLYGRLRPYLNKVFLPDFEGHCSTEIFPLACSSRLDRRFLYYWLTTESTVALIDRTSTGARMPRANVNAVLEFDFPLPPLAEQERIVAILDEAFAAIATATAHTERNLANAREVFESELEAVFSQRGDGWVEKTLGEISKRVSVGHVGPTSEYYCDKREGIPFLRSQNVRPGRLDLDGVRYITRDFHEKLKKSQLQAGDLLFVRVGANRGDCCSVTDGLGEMNCANIVFARPRQASISFLEYYCQSPIGRERLLGMTTGSAQGVINTKSVAELCIPLPSLYEQKRLAGLLDDFRNEIESLSSIYQQKLTLLAELKQSLLHKAFRGELTGGATEVPRTSEVRGT